MNSFFDVDMSKMMDLQKVMADYRVPGVGVESMMAAQRRNIEAVTAANQLAVEGMQAVMRRQAEILRQMMDEASAMMSEMLAAGTPEDKVGRQADMVKEAFEKTLANMRELSEMVAKSNNEAADVISRRVGESLEELKSAMARSTAR